MPDSRPIQHPIPLLGRPLTGPLLLLLAALLRFYRLSGQSLWADEGNSVALARRGFVEIAQRTAFDIHPPLYYWLLKLWIAVFGEGEIGLRSLSVILGIGLVYVTGLLGARFFNWRVGLTAALIAALSPLQIYYSQEARMYMLLTLLSALTVLVAHYLLERYMAQKQLSTTIGVIFILIVTAGLYTHYAFPLILAAVNLTALIRVGARWRGSDPPLTGKRLFTAVRRWVMLHLIPLLLYLPWLPIAWRQITTWPTEQQGGELVMKLNEISTTLLFGLTWPFEASWVTTAGLALVLATTTWLGLKRQRHDSVMTTRNRQREASGYEQARFYGSLLFLWLWLLFPIILTIVIFSPAFLKFLLVATPPLTILLALAAVWLLSEFGRIRVGRPSEESRIDRTRPGIEPVSPPSWPGFLAGGLLLAIISGASALALYHYYSNPAFARDNYRGIANFIKAVGRSEDAIILNAEGQQDVFNYYYEREPGSSAPVFPLPRQRPLDESATRLELQQMTADAEKIYAVYWATEQADPNGLIEGWLDQHLLKAKDQWYGNVRLVSYANPQANEAVNPRPVDYRLGDRIRLTGFALSSTQAAPGDILQITLFWETTAPLAEDLTVFAQILDPADHLVGQRDARPLIPTSKWPVGEAVADGHGIFIEPGTPPGKHRLIVGLYDSATGRRLPVRMGHGSTRDEAGDFIELGEVEIVRPERPLPLEAFKMQVSLNAPMLDVTLLGYDLYKLGHRSAPDTPLHPGDPLHLVAYWRPRGPVRWLEDQLFIQVVSPSGRSSQLFVTRHPSGTDYPIKSWQPGEIIRAQYDLFLNDVEPGTYRLALTLGVSQTSMRQVVALTQPFQVE